MSMLDHALAYAARGWPVFPCDGGTKRPLTPAETSPGAKDGGYHLATTNEVQIRAWWKRWPHAMIGVPTGSVVGAWVLDLDARKAGVPVGALRAAVEAAIGEVLPDVPVTATPGGEHLWFALPALVDGQPVEVGNRANVIRKDIDVRGDGTGYVIVPPSARRGAQAQRDGVEGAAYAWRPAPDRLGFADPDTGEVWQGTDFQPAPEALLRLVCRMDPSPSGDTFLPSPSGDGVGSRYGNSHDGPAAPAGAPDDPREDARRKFALSALDLELRALSNAAKGSRGDTLNRVGFALGQIVGAGYLTRATVEAGIWSALASNGLVATDGQRRCADTIKRSIEDGMREPRDMSGVGQKAGSARPRSPREDRPAGPAAPRGAAHRGSRGSRDVPSPSSGGAGGADVPPSGPLPEDEEPDPAAVAELVDEPQNDTGNGRRLLKHYGKRMLMVRDVGPHVWAGTHWEPLGGKEAFMRLAQRTAEHIALEAEHIFPSKRDALLIEKAEELAAGDPDDLGEADKKIIADADKALIRLSKRRGDRRKFAISCGNANRLKAMIDMAAPHHTVAPDALDVDPYAINLLNGTLRMVPQVSEEWDPDAPAEQPRKIRVTRWAMRLDDHDPADRIAKVMPVAWDKAATCPKFLAFMEMVQPRADMRRFLQTFYGYGLMGLTAVQAFVFHYGHGANGKSTFMETMARLQGPYGRMLPAEALTGDSQRRSDQATPEFARLPGARMVRCAELPRGQGFRESTLKMLTGGEPILVRHLNEGFFEFKPIFKVTGSGNDKPAIGGVDEGIWRRMKLVPWAVTIPESERREMEEVLAEFAAEAPGILNWLIEGALAYLHDGMVVPHEIRAATDEYRHEMDPVGEFLKACVEECPGEKVTARTLYTVYTDWCHENSVKPFAEKGFAGIMGQKGIKKEALRVRKYSDIKIVYWPKDVEEQEQYPKGYGG